MEFASQEEVEGVQEKLKHAEVGQQRSGIIKFFMNFVTPALLEALVLTFIAGDPPPPPTHICLHPEMLMNFDFVNFQEAGPHLHSQ